VVEQGNVSQQLKPNSSVRTAHTQKNKANRVGRKCPHTNFDFGFEPGFEIAFDLAFDFKPPSSATE